MDTVKPVERPRSRVANWALVVLFLAAIWTPLAINALGVRTLRLDENRVRAARPRLEFNRAALAMFPARFEAYFNDTFGLRDQLIRWNNLVLVKALGVSSSPYVWLGREGWLYLSSEWSAEDYRRCRPFSKDELETWKTALEAKRDWLASRGIRYLPVVAPNKHSIYPEYMPGTVRPLHRATRLDQLLRYMRNRSDVTLLDLREPLLRSKSSALLYLRRDTHWNARGAMVGYQAIMAELSRWFPGLRAAPVSAFRPVRIRKSTDLSLMLGLGDSINEDETIYEPSGGRKARNADPGPAGRETRKAREKPPWVTECDGPGLPRAVVFGDSFFGPMHVYFAEHFARCYAVWHTPFDLPIIEQEHPQVVIEEFVERKLYDPPFVPVALRTPGRRDPLGEFQPAIASKRREPAEDRRSR